MLCQQYFTSNLIKIHSHIIIHIRGNLITVTFSGKNKENFDSSLDRIINSSKLVDIKLLNSSENAGSESELLVNYYDDDDIFPNPDTEKKYQEKKVIEINKGAFYQDFPYKFV